MAAVRTSLSTLGWAGGVDAEGTERVSRGAGGLWSDTEGDTTRRIDAPTAKPFSLEILGQIPPGGREFGCTPSLTPDVDQELNFYGQILVPLMGKNCILFLM